jgi:hypothetical protein
MAGSMLFVGIPGQALAQAMTGQIPENAQAKSYGTGWSCNPGYRESNDASAAIEIPENGYATSSSFGTGWECSYGFKESNGSCTPVQIPANAHVDYSGNGWYCNKPYRKRNKDLFTPYGEVTSARVLTTRHGGHPRGFGYVEMLKQHAERAISESRNTLCYSISSNRG